jgi:hypothetical protein
MNYYPGWYPPPQYPPNTPPQQSGVVYVPIDMNRGGRPTNRKGFAKQLKELFEAQELLNRAGGKKEEAKKNDGPKVAMIPIPLALFFGVLLSPAVGPIVYLCYKSLWTMALGH